ncbi:hypothetical protein LLG46_00930 [bacterium]|nr:hypothetical protein [bacterium]
MDRQVEVIESSDIQDIERRIGAATEEGRNWTYREVQSPVWINFIISITIVVFYAGAVFTPEKVLPVIIGSFCIALLGGLRIRVSSKSVQVRLGIFDIPLLTLKMEDIEQVDVHRLPPLVNIGDWKIHLCRQMKTYCLCGKRGVKLTSTRSKQYLIGSDNPELLAEVIRIARRMTGY